MHMNIVKSFRKLALHLSKKDNVDTVLQSQIFTADLISNVRYTNYWRAMSSWFGLALKYDRLQRKRNVYQGCPNFF
jgi:hypothetical protein